MIVVTGSSGFLGSEVVRQLVAAGQQVRAVDLHPATDSAAPGVERQVGDLRAPEVSHAAVRGADAVIHCAAVQFHSPGLPRFRIEPFFRRNPDMTRVLLDAAGRAGVERFVHVSTDMVYGPQTNGPMREDAPKRPVGPYGRSKLASERLCEAARGSIPHLTILRPSLIIGPGRLGLMAKLFEMIRTHRAVPMFGAGHNRHHMIAVSDLAAACRRALERPLNAIFNIASNDPPTTRDMLAEVCRRAGSRSRLIALPAGLTQLAMSLLWSVRISPMVPEQYLIAPVDYVLDTAAARDSLGFDPQRHDTDTMYDSYRWYLDSLGAARREER